MQQEAATNPSPDDVMMLFQPGVDAPDAPIIMSYWHALVLMVGVLMAVGIIFYLMVHLSPPLW